MLSFKIICGAVTFLTTIALLSIFLIIPHNEDPKLIRKIPLSYIKPELLTPEERDILEDMRTSFIPSQAFVIPIEHYNAKSEQNDKELNENDWYEQYRNDFIFPDYPLLSSLRNWFGEENIASKNENIILKKFMQKREIKKKAKPNGDCNNKDQCNEDSEAVPSTSLQSFWGHSGSAESVREHQSWIMKRYMDMTADPCQDFYKYACGNWASINPIPSDKAGLDTVELLRENLDQVLKQLLTSEKVREWENQPFLPDNSGVKKYLQMEPIKIIAKMDHIEEDSLDYISNRGIGSLPPDRKKRNSKNRMDRFVDMFRSKRDIIEYSDETYDKIRSIKKRHRFKRLTKGEILKDDKFAIFGGDSALSVHKSGEDVTENCSDDDPIVDAIAKAKYFYESCMNYNILKKRENQPLLDLLNKLGGWPMLNPDWNATEFDWLELIGILRLFNNDILISEWVGPDIKKSDEFIVQFDQSHLGLPTPEYYLQDNNDFLQAYNQYIVSVAMLLGVEPSIANESASDIVMFEKNLAGIIIPPESRRRISELYQRMTVKELTEEVPKINWKRYLCIVLNRTVSWNESVVIYATKYVKDLADMIEQTPAKTVANYILWRFVRHRVNNLDDKFQDAKQKFYNKLFGSETSPPRWKNCVAQVNANMGMALGSLFVSKYFDENSKNDTLIMTREIQSSFRQLLNLTSWIDEETKKLAIDKVDAMMLRIGYPDFVLDHEELNKKYSEVTIHPERYFENTLNILRHVTKLEHAMLGQVVNKTQWNTPPGVVNAYYSRNKNQILFPAGILQPPFYHKHFPKCLNFGGIGVVIGHEITHGFDDKGRLFDKHGNLQKWWSEDAIQSFHSKAQCLIDQYNEYQVVEVSMSLDGTSTQGENIADNGGIKQAYRAYQHWLEQNGNIEESLPGLNATSSQLFFLNFAQIWCGVMRPEAMKNKLKVAVHSPGRFRVIGTVSNSEDFAKAFNCPVGSSMNPSKKCDVW